MAAAGRQDSDGRATWAKLVSAIQAHPAQANRCRYLIGRLASDFAQASLRGAAGRLSSVEALAHLERAVDCLIGGRRQALATAVAHDLAEFHGSINDLIAFPPIEQDPLAPDLLIRLRVLAGTDDDQALSEFADELEPCFEDALIAQHALREEVPGNAAGFTDLMDDAMKAFASAYPGPGPDLPVVRWDEPDAEDPPPVQAHPPQESGRLEGASPVSRDEIGDFVATALSDAYHIAAGQYTPDDRTERGRAIASLAEDFADLLRGLALAPQQRDELADMTRQIVNTKWPPPADAGRPVPPVTQRQVLMALAEAMEMAHAGRVPAAGAGPSGGDGVPHLEEEEDDASEAGEIAGGDPASLVDAAPDDPRASPIPAAAASRRPSPRERLVDEEVARLLDVITADEAPDGGKGVLKHPRGGQVVNTQMGREQMMWEAFTGRGPELIRLKRNPAALAQLKEQVLAAVNENVRGQQADAGDVCSALNGVLEGEFFPERAPGGARNDADLDS